MTRRDRILAKLRSVVHELSGIEPATLDAQATFLDMGFDSLFLTQASLGFRRELGVRITFRQLFDEAPSLAALAEYIDGELDDDVEVEPPAGTAAGDAAAGSAAAGSGGDATGASGPGGGPAGTAARSTGGPLVVPGGSAPERTTLQQILALQLQSTTALLAALQGGAGGETTPAPAAGRHAETAAGDARTAPAATPGGTSHADAAGAPRGTHEGAASGDGHGTSAETTGVGEAGDEPKKGHGPFREIERRDVSGYTERQRAFVQDVVDRYVEKTAGSRELTQAHRDAFADPRAVAGFRREWKDLVYPIAAERSKGSKMWDVDGNEYVDAVSGFGAIFFGHAPDFVVDAVDEQLHRTLDYGPQSTMAGDIAERIARATGLDRVAFCNTGSEAVLAAMRTARTTTGRDTIVTFQGDYHGIFDEVLVRRQDFGDRSRNVPVAPGIPRSASQHMVVLDYGAAESLDRIRELGPELGAVLVEPVQSRRPELQPRDFLHALRELCTEFDVPLIFDEIITGFRVHPRGAQGWFGVEADIVSYGKVIGGGMPIGIVAGRKRYMDALDGGSWRYGDDSFPEAGVTYFAGTFIRHPLSLAAVGAVIRHLEAEGPSLQRAVNARTVRLAAELNEHFERERLPIRIVHFGSVFLPRFGGRPDFDTIFHRLLHLHGLHLWEGRPGFLGTEHSEEDVDRIVQAFRRAAEEMIDGGLLEREPEVEEPVVVPFTEPQEELWVATQLNPDASPAYNEPVRLALEGPLHLAALRRSVGQLVRRHDALRTTVSADDEALVVHPTMEVPLTVVDLSGLDPQERERRREARLVAAGSERFDLAGGPLVRIEVMKLGEERWDLVMTVHHLACDGWSIAIALRDLSRFYSAAVTGRELDMEPAMGLEEYRAWYAERRESDDVAEAEAYWLERLRETPPVADLPTDHGRPVDRSYAGRRQAMTIPATVGNPLKEIGASHRCTLFTTVFASFNVLLHRLTGETDLVVGVPSAGQAMLGGNDLVAHCVHYLPIRTEVTPDTSFERYLDGLRDTVLDANSHADATFGEIIKKLTLPRDRSRVPLLTAGFNLDPELTGLDFHGLEWRYDPMPRRYCKLDLAVNVVETDGELLVEIDHNADLIEPATALRWGRHWATLLEAIVEDPSRAIRDLPLLREDARTPAGAPSGDAPAAVPEDSSGTADAPAAGAAGDLPTTAGRPDGEVGTGREADAGSDGADARRANPGATVHGLIEAAADRVPDRPAVADERGRRLTYAELDARANRLANHLRALGVATESVVAVDLPRGVDLVAALVAIHKAGGAYLPIDDPLPPDRIRFMLADSGAEALVTVSGRAERAGDFDGASVLLDDHAEEMAARSADRPDADVTPENLAYVIYTSGSTGTPKGVETTHANVVHLLRGTDADVPLAETDVMLAVTTVAFDQSVLQLFAPLTHGGSVVVADAETASNGRRLAELIDRTDANIMKATPAVWRILVHAGWEGKADLRAFSGGEALPPDLARRLATLCAEAWNHYGPTETTGHTTSWRISEEDAPVRIGTPLPDARVFVLNENLQPLPPGIVGELFVGGPGVARGYRNRPELTAERFVPDPFSDDPDARLYRTGDLGRRDEDGTFEYVGRTDAQVKVRGFRIELGEIEAVLRSHPAVADAAARVWDGGTIDARLVGYVVLGGGADAPPPTGSELRAFLRDRVPDYMVPGLVLDLDHLPLTPRGKLDRMALPDPFGRSGAEAADGGDPETEVEKLVAEVWADMLDISDVRRGDNFFELGGHSLLAVRAATTLTKRTGVDVDPRSLFFHTVEQLARSIEERAGSGELATARE